MSQERTSPSRVTRVQEKEELAELNDRFLQYIEQVRSMKAENLRLEMDLCEVKERLGGETESIKTIYEAELADARNLIDETAKEKARQQIIASKNASRVEDLETELKEVRDALERMEAKYNASERNAASLDAQRKSAIVEKNKYQKQAREQETELAELRESCDTLKSNLETETLSKVDLQNHIQSLKEELAFRKKVYEEELAGYKEKRSVHITGEFDTEFQAELNKRVEIAIDELREDSDAKIEAYKDQLETAYKDQIATLNDQILRYASSITQLKVDLEKAISARSDQEGEVVKLRRKIDKLETTIRDLKDELDRCRRQHSKEMEERTEELLLLRERYEAKIREYEELMDVKVQLDQEIATYRVLLTGEETRLNLTPTPREKRTRTHTQQSTESASKRARLDTSQTQSQKTSSTSNTTGRIQITEVDTEGRYIEIKNISDEVEPIGGLKIQHEVEGGCEVFFRFHNKSKLQGGACVKVWSGDAEGAVHNPPTDLIWRNQSWGSGRKTLTKLIKGGEEIAQFRQNIEASPSKPRDEVDIDTGIGTATGSLDSSVGSFPHLPETEVDSSAGGSRTTTRVTKHYTMTTRSGARQQREQQVGGEHVFHQRGDPEPAGEKSCIIS